MKKNIFLIFVMFFLIILLCLINGISVAKCDFKYFSFSQLYVKLDKKLILEIKDLKIHKNKNSEQKSTNSAKQLLSLLKNAGILNKTFKRIYAQNINYGDMNASFIYENDKIYLNTPYLLLDASIKENHAHIKNLFAKDFDIRLNGDVVVNLANDSFEFSGELASYELNASAQAKLKDDDLSFELKNISTPSIDNFMNALAKQVNMNENLKKWIHIYIKAQKYDIHELSATMNLKNPQDLKINATASAQNLKLKFMPKLDEISINSAQISLKNDILSFELDGALFNGKSLAGTNVQVVNVVGADSHVLINLRSKDLNYNDTKNILKAFDIDIIDFDMSAKLNSKLLLDLKITPLELRASGEFIVPKNTFSFKDSNFSTNGATIALKDDIINFKSVNLNNENFDVNFNGEFNSATQIADLNANFNKIYLNNILDMNNSKQKIKIQNKDFFKLSIDDLGLMATISQNQKNQQTTTLTISNISKLTPYSKLANSLNLISGAFFLSTDDFVNFNIKLENANFDLGLKKLDKSPYNSDNFSFQGTFKNAQISSKSEHLSANIKNSKTHLKLKNLIVPISTDANNTNDLELGFSAINTKIHLKDLNRTLNFDNFNGLFANKSLDFAATFANGALSLQKTPFSVKIKANNIPSDIINEVLDIKTFDGGLFGLSLFGRDFENFKAEIIAKNTYLADYKAQSGLLAFLDSVPSLLIFKVPDFSNKGFGVEDGRMLLERKGDVLEIKASKLSGKNADIFGMGNINLASKNLRVDLELSVLKSYATLVGFIPVINKILLGDNNRFSTIIKVRGNLDNPTFKSSVGADLASSPFNIIKNTLSLPFSIFEK